jgi:hypothetical protein
MRRQLQHKGFTIQSWNDLSSLSTGYCCVQENKNDAPIGNSENYIRPRYNH